MDKNKLIAASLAGILLCGGIFAIIKKNGNQADNIKNVEKQHHSINVKNTETDTELAETGRNEINKVKRSSSENKSDNVVKQDELKIHNNSNLYSDITASSLPLSSIVIAQDLPNNIKSDIDKIYENKNVFMTKKTGDKLFIITENSENIRHEIEFTEISLVNGQKTNTTLGYNGKSADSQNDIWEYDKDTKKPIRHTVYDKNGDMIFVENWNYSPAESVKYEMKDANNKVISLRKETLENGTDLRVEHLVYDGDGNTKINVTAFYDGADIKRFTYYNADKPEESGSVFSEYSDGLKTKESVYTSDLKLKNTLTSEYDNGSRTSITVYDTKNNEIEKLSAE